MRLSRTSIQKAVTGVALGAGLATTGAVNAGVVYDLRFAGGGHSVAAVAGTTYNLELWIRVSGADTNRNEGMQSSLTTIVSTQSGGGGITSGGVTGATVATMFQSFNGDPADPSSTPLHRSGGPNNITNDSVVDWGGTGAEATDTNYLLARNSVMQGSFSTISGSRQPVDANTFEFKLATYTVAVNALGSGTTSFKVVEPSLAGTLPATYIVARVDGLTYNVDNQGGAAPTYSGSQGVTFVGGVIPEPASLGLAGVAAIGLLGRRRRTK